MNRRETLTRAVKVMFGALALAFLFVLFRSLSGPSMITNPARVFDDVQLGQTALRRIDQTRVWGTRLSPIQRKQADNIAPFVVDPGAGCAVTAIICAVAVTTDRDGIELMFTDSVPAQLPSNAVWFGGFVDPTNNAVFDRFGRAYKDTSRGGSKQGAKTSLTVIPVE